MLPDAARRPGSACCGIAPLLLLALLSAGPTPAETVTPMTNEDVVRMTASGEPTWKIIDAIRSAPAVAFDLDPEIIIELRRAKVDSSVIEAMKEVSVASSPPPPEPGPTGILRLAFEDDKKKDPMRSTIAVPARSKDDDPVSLALFLFCTYPTHVPDLWLEHTSLLFGFQRHRLHLFHQETSEEKWRGSEVLLLDRPEGIELPLPAGIHTLVVGIAARSGELPWMLLLEDSESVMIEPDRTTTLTIRLSTRTSVRRMSGSPHTCQIVRKSAPQAPQER